MIVGSGKNHPYMVGSGKIIHIVGSEKSILLTRFETKIKMIGNGDRNI